MSWILKDVHIFVSTFSVELVPSIFFSFRTRLHMDYTQYSTATYISVVTSACCFLVMITSSLLRTHRKKDFFSQSASLQSESHCALYAMACKNMLRQHKLLSPLHVLSRMGTRTGIMQVYFDNCQEDRTPNKY